jgi:hypothetical protein
MPDYRLYRLDPQSGHFMGVEELSAADDGEAICLTTRRHFEVPIELWCGGHKVARLDARPEHAATAPRIQRQGRDPS